MVRIDPAQLDQVLANLCVNSRDAITGTGRITIQTRNVTFDQEHCTAHPECLRGEWVLLTVSDDGRGMDAKTITHVFEPFFTTKGVGKGTGLGLATVYGVVKQNDGFITVTSEPGRGTSFFIHLPRQAGVETGAFTEARHEPVEGDGETVLIVEDEPMILQLAATMLRRLGYSVLSGRTPGEAIRLAKAHANHIHLVMTDIVMPEMNGRELAERLKGLCPGLKCLYTSGYTADVIATNGVLEEGVHFLQKPYSLEQLAAAVREAVRG
jgi:CheY-like chemotaxis protein